MEQPAMVKMTVLIPKELHRRAKVRAAETDRDMREVVIEALEVLLRAERKGKR
jgi:predicted HicB family RNase H-like nuclease